MSEPASRDALTASATAEADGFYTLMATISSGFLGGTLVFIEKIASNPSQCSLVLLGLGWAALIFVLISMVTVRYLNLVSLNLCLVGKQEKAGFLYDVQQFLCVAAIFLMLLGMCAIFIFGFLNVWSKIPSREVHAMASENDDPKPQSKEEGPRGFIKEGGIPYHNLTKPAEPAPKPADSDSDKKK